MAGADLRRAVVERAERPRLVEHLDDVRAERRRARVAGLQLVEALRQLRRQPRPVDAELLEDRREVAVGGVEQLHEVVLDLDVVVRAGQAQAGRRFDGAPRRVIQLADEGSEIDSHASLVAAW